MSPIDRIQVKRCFVASELCRSLSGLGPNEFSKEFRRIASQVEEASEAQLDLAIRKKDMTRLVNYNNFVWKLGQVSTARIGIWCGSASGAKGLPFDWCKGSIRETALFVRASREKGELLQLAPDAEKAIIGIEANIETIQNEPLLYPIACQGGTIRQAPCKVLDWDLDDGNMRALTVSVIGKAGFCAYLGTQG